MLPVMVSRCPLRSMVPLLRWRLRTVSGAVSFTVEPLFTLTASKVVAWLTVMVPERMMAESYGFGINPSLQLEVAVKLLLPLHLKVFSEITKT